MKKHIKNAALAFALSSLITVGCSEKDGPSPENDVHTVEPGNYLISVKAGGSSDNTYFIPVSTLEDPTLVASPVGHGLEINDNYSSNYVWNGYNQLVALKYGQGNAHLGVRVSINDKLEAEVVGPYFEIEGGFVSAGKVGNVAYTAMSGHRAKDSTVATINMIPMDNSEPKFGFMKVDEFKGYEGIPAQMIGIADAGEEGAFFTSLDFSLVNEEIDDVVVAKVNAKTLTPETVYTDSRLNPSGGKYRSARYSQIGTTSTGDAYVFSGNYNGTKKAGALLIKKGADEFDQEYYFNIEDAAGGYRFRKVFYVQGSTFLIEFYNDKYEDNTSPGGLDASSQYALVDMETKSLKWVQGLPNKTDIAADVVQWPYVDNGKIYMGLTTTLEDPRFYVIDAATAVAKPGLLVKNASAINTAMYINKNK